MDQKLQVIQEIKGFKPKMIDHLSIIMEHMQKIIHIAPSKAEWYRSVFKGIYDAKKLHDNLSHAEVLEIERDIENILAKAYKQALNVIDLENKSTKDNFDRTRPAAYTFSFLTDFGRVKKYLEDKRKEDCTNDNGYDSLDYYCDLYSEKYDK